MLKNVFPKKLKTKGLSQQLITNEVDLKQYYPNLKYEKIHDIIQHIKSTEIELSYEYPYILELENNKYYLHSFILFENTYPKNNKEYTKIYIDRLQRLGANILGRKKKSIAYYYTQKQNTGKSALRSLTSLVNDCAVIHPSILGDNFNYEVIGGKKLY